MRERRQTELFRGKRAKKERESGTPTGTVRGRRVTENSRGANESELHEMLAGSTGLEPAASGVTGRRSNQLNYDPKELIFTFSLCPRGGRCRVRTCDSRRVRPVLYH